MKFSKLIQTLLVSFSLFLLSFVTAQSAHAQGPRVYVANEASNNVSVIDSSTDTVIATVPVGQSPRAVFISPDRTRVYVSNFTFCCSAGPGTISVIDTTSPSYPVIATIPAGNNPGYIISTPDGTKLYIVNVDTSTIRVVDSTTYATLASIALPSGPFTVGGRPAMNPAGTRLYIGLGSAGIAIIDLTNDTLLSTVSIPLISSVLAISPDGNLLYVAHNTLGLTVFDTTTNTVLTTIAGSGRDIIPVVNSIGSRVYISNEDAPGKVDVFDSISHVLLTTIDTNQFPSGLGILPDDSKLYVANADGGNIVSVIDTATNTVVHTITVGSNPLELAVENISSSPTCSWSGFLQPINTDGSSIFKQKSTVNVKAQLTGSCTGQTNATITLYVAKITDNVVGTVMEAESNSQADTGNTFHYDATNDQYLFHLGTKNLTTGTYQLSVYYGGTNITGSLLGTVNISLK